MICAGVSKEGFRLIEGPHFEALRGEQILHRSENGSIVIDQTDFSLRSLNLRAHAAALVSCTVPRAAGKRTTMRAPRSGAFSASIVPPCASTIDRTMARP